MNHEKIITYDVFLFGILFTLMFSLFGQLHGADSWYWLSAVNYKISLVNFFAFFMWIGIFILFTFVKDARNPYFIAALFLLNPLSIKLLEVEIDDYLIILLSFLVILYFKNKPYRFITHKRVAALMTLTYLFVHDWYGGLIFVQLTMDGQRMVTENIITFYSLFSIVPVIYLLMANRQKNDFHFILAYFILFATPKFINTGLIFFIFALYLDFATNKEFKYDKKILWVFLAVLIILGFRVGIEEIIINHNAIEHLCSVGRECFDNQKYEYLKPFFNLRGYNTV